jgi:hypothetical protein
MDQPWNGASAAQSHLQSVAAELGAHVILHRPADDLPRGHVFDASQIEPAFVRVDVGDVGQPNRVGRHTVELLLQEVWRWAHLVIAVCSDRLSAFVQAWRNLVFLHYSSHATFRNDFTIGQKVLLSVNVPFTCRQRMDALGTVTFLASPEEGFDLW